MGINLKLAKFQTIKSKMEKTLVLSKNCVVDIFIPETVIFSIDNLGYMLDKYDMVVFKPDGGTGGKNVGMISKMSHDRFNVQMTDNLYENISFNKVYKFIAKISKKKTKFILQRGIKLLKYNGNVVDIRVLIQKPYQDWEITGIVGKVAEGDKIVTNSGYGGKGIPIEELLTNLKYSNEEIEKLKVIMSSLAYQVADTLNEKYRGIRALGLDIGLDEKLYPWILEVNTKPGYKRFDMIEDKTMFNQITSYYEIIINSSGMIR